MSAKAETAKSIYLIGICGRDGLAPGGYGTGYVIGGSEARLSTDVDVPRGIGIEGSKAIRRHLEQFRHDLVVSEMSRRRPSGAARLALDLPYTSMPEATISS